jgi:chromosome segregation ATPase
VNANPAFVKQTTKTLNDFIRGPAEMFFKKFFITEMDAMLEAYTPGRPEMKPDVIEQTKVLEQTMAQLQEQERAQAAGSGGSAILMQQEGKEPVALTSEQVLNVIQTQQTEIKTLNARVASLDAEKAKLDATLQYLISAYTEADASVSKLVEQCSNDVADRDEKLRKTKALYIKSVNECSDLKKQIAELRAQLQSSQSGQIKQENQATADPIRLVIDK